MNITSSSPKKDFILGLFFFGGIGALLYSTVVLTGFSLDARPVLEVRFADAAGLREGDAVLVSGRHAGSVLAVRWLPDEAPDRRIGVDLELEGPLILHQDYRIRISEFTLLGGRVVEINPGLPSSPSIPSGTVLSGQMGISTLAALGELVAENRNAVDEIVENLRLASRGLARGEGVLGSLLHDPEMLRDLEGILESARAIGKDIREGKGALGLLASDPKVREQLVSLLSDGAAAMTDLALIADDLSEGRGALGALLAEPDLREDSLVLIDNFSRASIHLRRLLEDAEAGKGLLGMVAKDENLAADARAFLADLRALTNKVRAGEGSLGRFLNEDAPYEEFLAALNALNRQLEDAREAQPVSSFAAMLFGSQF